MKWQWIGVDAQPRQAYRTDPAGNLLETDDPIAPFTVSNLGLQIRYRYEIGPQSELFLVYGRGGFDLLMDDERDVSQFAVMDQARAILQDYPDLRSSVQGVNALASGGSRLSDVELNLRGPDLDRLLEYADRLMAGMREMPGLVDVDTTLAVRTPELRLLIDREKASDLGLNVQDIATTVQTFIAGQPVSKFKEDDQQYDIWLRADPGRRRTQYS